MQRPWLFVVWCLGFTAAGVFAIRYGFEYGNQTTKDVLGVGLFIVVILIALQERRQARRGSRERPR